MIKYSEILVHLVCATKNILKTPKNIRRYDFILIFASVR